jgi:hypothetical protein
LAYIRSAIESPIADGFHRTSMQDRISPVAALVAARTHFPGKITTARSGLLLGTPPLP